MSGTETITEAELADALKVLAVRTGNGNSYFPELARNIFEYVTAHREPGSDGEEPPDLPDGTWARVEMPGYRENTGWVTEGDCFGARAAVVRDWDGGIEAEVVLGPGCRVVRLPAPLRHPEPRAALPAGGPWRGGEDFGDHGNDEDGPF